jgi:hypothetical protein
MSGGEWSRNEDEQRRREAALTLEQKLAWLDQMIETAVMLGYKPPPRPTFPPPGQHPA